MKNFKLFLLNFVLFVYVNYVAFDWDEFSKTAKFFLYPAWFVNAILTWIVCVVFIPEYFVKQTKFYKELDALMTQEFLNQ